MSLVIRTRGLSVVESRIASGADASATITRAEMREAEAHTRGLLGLHSPRGEWWTAPDHNAKLALAASGADPTYAAGLTLLPAHGLRDVIATLDTARQAAVVDALHQVGITNVGTNCTRSTAQCRATCVLTSGRGSMPGAIMGRAARTLMWLLHPAEAWAMDHAAAVAHDRRYGPAARRRWCIADDIRWMLIAPEQARGLFSGRQYQYSKHSAAQLPEQEGHVIVRSATGERGRWTVDSIREATAAGQRVAVVIDTPRGVDTPRTWAGIPAIDGDATDDRTLQAAGTVCLLRAKGAARGMVGQLTGSFVFPTHP